MQKTYGEEISEDDVKNKRVFFDTSLVPRIKFVKISEEAMADYQVKVVPVILKMACFVGNDGIPDIIINPPSSIRVELMRVKVGNLVDM